MKTKLEMAHEFMLAMIKAGCHDGPDLLDRAWCYADAMQAEADKRKPSGFPNVLRGACGEIVAVKVDDMEWQPDWSQAPEWANFLVMSCKGTSYWHSSEPRPSGAGWVGGGHCDLAHLDGYHSTDDWRNSLRKRPK